MSVPLKPLLHGLDQESDWAGWPCPEHKTVPLIFEVWVQTWVCKLLQHRVDVETCQFARHKSLALSLISFLSMLFVLKLNTASIAEGIIFGASLSDVSQGSISIVTRTNLQVGVQRAHHKVC